MAELWPGTGFVPLKIGDLRPRVPENRALVDGREKPMVEVVHVAIYLKFHLIATRMAGFKTAFVPRPLELGPSGHYGLRAEGDAFNRTINIFNLA